MEQEMSNKKKGGILLKVLLVLVGAAVAAAAAAAWVITGEIGGRSADPEASVQVVVEQGQGPATIAAALQEAGVIRYPQVFRLYLRQTGTASQLQYGTFELHKGQSYSEIVKALSQYAKAETVRVTFPDGNTALDFAARMEQAGLCTAEEFLACANGADGSDFSQYRFWNEMDPDPNCFMRCEGYLFPETYDFYVDGTVYDYVDTFYRHFDSVINDEMFARMEELGMSLHDIVVLASFVQEEAGNAENAHVSAVFHNRLAEGSPFPRLESNACSYVQRDDDNNYLYNWVAPYFGGWDNIPAEMYAAYDTYQMEGLPAGAISNPGKDALLAALYPDESFMGSDPYYFFVTDLTGKYYYGHTVSEHGANCNTAWAVNASLPKK